jgi:hypothetical protein
VTIRVAATNAAPITGTAAAVIPSTATAPPEVNEPRIATAVPLAIDPMTCVVCAAEVASPIPLRGMVATYIYFFPMLISRTPKISRPPISNVELDIVLRLVPDTETPADCLRIAPFALTTVPG